MSTVLSNGVIVPDVGSTNWASDLETNWTLLNALIGAVGANVRLDRPNIWTAAQTFSEGIYGDLDGTAAMAVNDANGNEIATTYALKTSVTSLQTAVTALQTAVSSKAADSEVVHLAGAETISGDKTFTGAVVTHHITPEADNTYSLGSSTLAWSAVYAQTYYYGGTEFSDKFLTANTVQSFTASKHLRAYNLKVGQGESYDRTGYSLVWTDKNDVSVGYIESFKNANAARTVLRIRAGDYYTNGTPDSEGTQVIASLRVGTLADSTRVIEAEADAVYPATNKATDLGTSSNKWKTLNGINPGALSLPDTYIDLDTTGWNLTGTSFNYVPSIDGWLFINVRPNNNYAYVAIEAAYMRNNSENTTGRNAMACIAVRKNVSATITLVGARIAQARLVSCAGNV